MKRQKPIVFIIIVVALVISLILRQRNRAEHLPGNNSQERTDAKNDARRDARKTDTRAEQSERSSAETGRNERGDRSTQRSGSEIEFNRKLNKVVYTKHARCRMGCRKIDESEILEIRDEGKVNYEKSELNSGRDPKFAVEGLTHDNQFVRVVFAQTSNSLVVVTCIDLDTDWACSCN